MQTGGLNGSYYLSYDHLDYSGSLDSGLARADIGEQIGERPGEVWFFDQGICGAGRGCYHTALMRLFAVRGGADLTGIGELRCPFWLVVFDARRHEQSCNYWYAVSRDGLSHTAFHTETELRAWLTASELALTQSLTPPGESSRQNLAYA